MRTPALCRRFAAAGICAARLAGGVASLLLALDLASAQTLPVDAAGGPAAACEGRPDLTPCVTTTSPDYAYDICVAGKCVSPGCGTLECNVPSPTFALPADDWPAAQRYTRWTGQTPTEPTVRDRATGLEWQGCMAGLGGPQCERGERRGMPWGDALAHCDGSRWGGHSDWRLPSDYEVMSILDLTRHDPAMDPGVWPNIGAARRQGAMVTSVLTWTSQTNRNDLEIATFVYFTYGYPSGTKKFNPRVGTLCVRGGTPLSGPRYVRASDLPREPVVTDAATHREWQGCVAGRFGAACEQGQEQRMTPAQGDAYCRALTWGGEGGWRSPTLLELYSLLHASKASTSPMGGSTILVDEQVFPHPASQHVSLTHNPQYPDHRMGVTYTFHGATRNFGAVQQVAVRCVRTAY